MESHFAAKRLILIRVLECSLVQSNVGFASATAAATAAATATASTATSAKITKCRKSPKGHVGAGQVLHGSRSLDWQFRSLRLS